MNPFVYSALNRLTSLSTTERAGLFRDEDLLENIAAGRAGRFDPGGKLSKSLAKLDWEKCRKEDEALLAQGTRILAWPDPDYPEMLKNLPDPPAALYLAGCAGALKHPAVAVVGSRLSTVYGQNVARMIGEDLARDGVTVVSGLARGIDACAHQGSLKVYGRAAAVIGTGIDVVYPPEHRELQRKIVLAGGAVVTEFPPGTPPLPRNFPVRNRIIAGLASATLVVEATERSGSLVTARCALETGRDVFAVPHNITTRTGVGPNTLIQKGARLVQRASDILEDMPDSWRGRLVAPEPAPAAGPGGDKAAPPSGSGAAQVLSALQPDHPQSIDELSAATGLPPSRLLALLLELKISDKCIELPGMRYALQSARKED